MQQEPETSKLDTSYFGKRTVFRRLLEILSVSTRLGVTSFGGPIAHLGYFHSEYVKKRKWLDESSYADLVALCQLLPGPASSQVGIGIGMIRAGIIGGMISWIGFTLPSAILMTLFAYSSRMIGSHQTGWLHGLLLVSVAVVAQAVWSMAKSQTGSRTKIAFLFLAAFLNLIWPTSACQLLTIGVSGILGYFLLKANPKTDDTQLKAPVSGLSASICLFLFAVLLIGLTVMAQWAPQSLFYFANAFYRAGSLVFGGGHVVLPILQSQLVPAGLVTSEQFLAGYGAAQAVPGPLFTFAAFLGAVHPGSLHGVWGAAFALFWIFLPSFLLVIGVFPFWNRIRSAPKFQRVLKGIHAGVVGILLAALYNPIWVNAVRNGLDLGFSLVAFGLLTVWKVPSWAVVLLMALIGGLFEG